MKLFVVLKLLVLLPLASSIEINCNFQKLTKTDDSKRTYSTLADSEAKHVYSCEVDELETTEHENYITEVSGHHSDDMTNENVTHFKVADQKVEFFPGGLEKFFPNLETVTIKRSAMRFIFKADLVGLSRLKFLALGDNKIESLGPGLFEGNPLLEEIHFENNKLSKISEDLLDALEAFPKVIHFFNNECIKEDLKTPDAKTFKDFLKKSCEMSKNDVIENNAMQVKKLLAKIESLETNEVDSSQAPVAESNEEAEAEIEKLSNEIMILETNVTSAYEEIEEMDSEMKLLKESIIELESSRKKLTKNLTDTLLELESVEQSLKDSDKQLEEINRQLLNKTTTEDVIVMVMAKLAAKLVNYQEENADLDKKYEEKLNEKTLMIEKIEADRDRILEEKKAADKEIRKLKNSNKNLNLILTNAIANNAYKYKTKH